MNGAHAVLGLALAALALGYAGPTPDAAAPPPQSADAASAPSSDPAAQMPNLGLSASEAADLTAFLAPAR